MQSGLHLANEKRHYKVMAGRKPRISPEAAPALFVLPINSHNVGRKYEYEKINPTAFSEC